MPMNNCLNKLDYKADTRYARLFFSLQSLLLSWVLEQFDKHRIHMMGTKYKKIQKFQ